MWTDCFDQIFLINLPERKDRLIDATNELYKYEIKFQRIDAIFDQDGREGIYQTMQKVFKLSLEKNHERILVFEDDIKFLIEPRQILEACMYQLPMDFDMFYLGCNPPKPFKFFYSDNLLLVEKCLSLHAVAYSKKCIEKIVRLDKELPIDTAYANYIQPEGKCYAAYPMLATQQPSYSNIEKRHVDYRFLLQERFYENVKHLETWTKTDSK